MRDFLIGLAAEVRRATSTYAALGRARVVQGDSPGGDAQFDIDGVAEATVRAYVNDHAPVPLALYTEDRGLEPLASDPRYLLVVDPIDGTRAASAGLQMAMFSAALAPIGDGAPTIGDVVAGVLLELDTGAWLYSDERTKTLEHSGYRWAVPRLSGNTDLSRLFWSIEFNGHPMRLMADAYQHLVDRSANTGGIFVFNSACYSISRLITGQLDAYVDIGNRILHDHPHTEPAFRRAGRGNILHLFPYDIAASVYLAQRAGVTITDGYGESLASTCLTDVTPANQRSCIAAANPVLHERLLATINWDLQAGHECDGSDGGTA